MTTRPQTAHPPKPAQASGAIAFNREAVQARQSASYQRFLGAARQFWANTMFNAVRRQVARDIADPADTGDDLARYRAQLAALPTWQVFTWFERHVQRMRYTGPYGFAARADARRAELMAELNEPLPDHLLRLAPDLEPPAWYTSCDIHQHPGGLNDDPIAAFIYRDAVGSGVVGRPALHERFASKILNGGTPRSVVDLGCGFGRSSTVFASTAPDTEVTGVDLSSSCVTVAAHITPPALRPRMHFVQGDAQQTDLPSGAFDLVTSTMLLHEMPVPALEKMIAEAGRLTAPGGRVAHLDFLPPEDPLLREIYIGHARRNNEPFLLEHSRIDVEAAYRAAGFDRVEIEDFREDDSVRPDSPDSWRLPWKTIIAYKAGADRKPQ